MTPSSPITCKDCISSHPYQDLLLCSYHQGRAAGNGCNHYLPDDVLADIIRKEEGQHE